MAAGPGTSIAGTFATFIFHSKELGFGDKGTAYLLNQSWGIGIVSNRVPVSPPVSPPDIMAYPRAAKTRPLVRDFFLRRTREVTKSEVALMLSRP
jgi:hypothetical protein